MAAVPSIGRASLVEAPGRAPQAAATEGLYERHSDKILAYCRHQLGSREEAEDAVQTTFMNAFRALGRGVVPEAETAWLYKIAENVCLSRRRSSWRRNRIESPSDFDVIEEVVPGPSLQRDELIGIEAALASMPEQQRRAILLREWQGLSYREIADELELSQSAVETLIFRARRSLAQGLEQPESVKPKRKSFRRALHALDLGTVAAALKTLLAGSAAVKATAAAVAVTAAAGTAASVAPKVHSAPKAKPPAKAIVAAPVASPAAVVVSAAPRSMQSVAAQPDRGRAPGGHAAEPRGQARSAARCGGTRSRGSGATRPRRLQGPAQHEAPAAQPVAVEHAPAVAPPPAESPKHEVTPAPNNPTPVAPSHKRGDRIDPVQPAPTAESTATTQPTAAPAKAEPVSETAAPTPAPTPAPPSTDPAPASGVPAGSSRRPARRSPSARAAAPTNKPAGAAARLRLPRRRSSAGRALHS